MYLKNIGAKAVHLRKLGMSDRAIARALGVSDKTVDKAISFAGSVVPATFPARDVQLVRAIPCEPDGEHLAASSGRMSLETPGTASARTASEEATAIRSRVRNPRPDEGRD